MSLDRIFENRMKAILGEEFDKFEDAITGERVKALRVNPLKACESEISANQSIIEAEDPVRALISTDTESCSIPWESYGRIYEEETPGKHPYHEAGVYYIQEPSAMAPVAYLDPRPGEKVLDLCAAPGGKSTQIAAKMRGEGILVSNEIDRKRAQILSLNIERCGVRNALVTNMKTADLSDIFEGYFDKILVDAPCSGEGMFRKNDEAENQWSLSNVELCAKRQSEIISFAVKMLAPGGKLVYSTCTFSPEEDELQVINLMRAGLKPVKIEPYPGMVRASFDNLEKVSMVTASDEALNQMYLNDVTEEEKCAISECAVRLWPHKLKGEGHFLAVLCKEGDEALKTGLYSINGSIKPVKDDEIKPFVEFVEENINGITIQSVCDNEQNERGYNLAYLESTNGADKKALKKGKKKNNKKNSNAAICLSGILNGIPFMFGNQLYLAPKGLPGLSGLSVLRTGLHLGTMKKDRFEPSHSLALALNADNVRRKLDLSSDSAEVMSFIGGQTLRYPQKDPGWYIVTVDGYTLGWAKYAGGVFKNHYPKGLRIFT